MGAAVLMRLAARSLLVLALMLSACSGTRPTPRATQASTVGCAERWEAAYRSALDSGVADGEARRLADRARAECEGLGTTVPSIEPGASVPCAGDADVRNAPPVKGEPKLVSVYFSCEADLVALGTMKQPLYAFAREIPLSLTDSTEERLEGALREYLRGPLPSEEERGYFSASGSTLSDALGDVLLTAGLAHVSFDPVIEQKLGNLGTATASSVFVLESQAVSFQFPEVDTLELQVAGDCERFWHLFEQTCRRINRPL